MLSKSKLLHTAAALLVVFSVSASSFADTIRLKDGGIVKGRVVGFRDNQFVIMIGDGTRQRQMTYYSDEISAIEFDPMATPLSSNTGSPNMGNPNSNNGNSGNNTGNTGNNTIIPVTNSGNDPRPANTNTSANTKPIERNTSNPANTSANTNVSNPSRPAPPIRINTKVLADNTSNGWTNTGWVVKKGQKIRISGTGRISLGNGRYTTPSGVASIQDSEKLMKEKPTGAIIAVIGDDNNDFIFVGSSVEFVAKRDGALFLGVNEGYLDDNSGAYEVAVEIDPTTVN